jgi:hypothetical protein
MEGHHFWTPGCGFSLRRRMCVKGGGVVEGSGDGIPQRAGKTEMIFVLWLGRNLGITKYG